MVSRSASILRSFSSSGTFLRRLRGARCWVAFDKLPGGLRRTAAPEPRFRAPDVRACQPGRDDPMTPRLQREQDRAPVGHRATGPDEPCIAKDVELTRDRRSAQPELRRETGGPPRLKRKGSNDAAPGGIGEQFDSRAVSSWHNVSVDLVTAGTIMPAAALFAVVAPSGPNQSEPLAATDERRQIVPLGRNHRQSRLRGRPGNRRQPARRSFRLGGTIDGSPPRARSPVR